MQQPCPHLPQQLSPSSDSKREVPPRAGTHRGGWQELAPQTHPTRPTARCGTAWHRTDHMSWYPGAAGWSGLSQSWHLVLGTSEDLPAETWASCRAKTQA